MQHGIREYERIGDHRVLVAQTLSHAGRQVRPRARATDRPRCTTRQQLGIAGRPGERCMDVVVGHREVDATVAQPVVDRDDDSTGPLGDLPGDDIGLGHVQVAEHERSAVGPDEPAAGVIAGAVDPHGHLAVWAGSDGLIRSNVGSDVAVDTGVERLPCPHRLGSGGASPIGGRSAIAGSRSASTGTSCG